MTSFKVCGPFKIPYESRNGGRVLLFDKFWSNESGTAQFSNECGCYVFAIRAGRGLQPIYVGQATKKFKQETFTARNRNKYHSGFSEYAKGTPIIFFVVHPFQRGPRNEKEISQIEDFLIQAASAKNPKLQNIRGVSRPIWSIKGVVRSGSGKRTSTELEFGKLFNIHG